MNQRKIAHVVAMLLFLWSPAAIAEVQTSHVVNDAMKTLSGYLSKGISHSKKNLGRTALLLNVSDDFNPDVKSYFRAQIEARFKKVRVAEIVSCFACEAVHGYSDGNQIVIEKGITSNQLGKSIAQELSLSTFLEINVGFTGKAIVMTAKAVDTASSKPVWEKTYEIHSRFATDRGLVISIDLGPAYNFSAATNEDKYMAGISLLIGERFYGVGKVGVAFSTVFSAANFTFNQSTGPYISLNLNELTGKYFPWGELSVFTNPGYAMSDKSIGVVVRSGLVLDLGSFMHVTTEYQIPVYSQNPNKEYPNTALVSFGFDLF